MMDQAEETKIKREIRVYTSEEAKKLSEENAVEVMKKAEDSGVVAAIYATARLVQDPGGPKGTGTKIGFVGNAQILGIIFFYVFRALPPEARFIFTALLENSVKDDLEEILAASLASHPDVGQA